jgi:hypothetical protein
MQNTFFCHVFVVITQWLGQQIVFHKSRVSKLEVMNFVGT